MNGADGPKRRFTWPGGWRNTHHEDLKRRDEERKNQRALEGELGLYQYSPSWIRHQKGRPEQADLIRIAEILRQPEAIALLRDFQNQLAQRGERGRSGHLIQDFLDKPAFKKHLSVAHVRPLLNLARMHWNFRHTEGHDDWGVSRIEEGYLKSRRTDAHFSPEEAAELVPVLQRVHNFLMTIKSPSSSHTLKYQFDKLIERDDEWYLTIDALPKLCDAFEALEPEISRRIADVSQTVRDEWYRHAILNNTIPTFIDTNVVPESMAVEDLPDFIEKMVREINTEPNALRPDSMFYWLIPSLLRDIPNFGKTFNIESVKKIKEQVNSFSREHPTEWTNLVFTGILPSVFRIFGKDKLIAENWIKSAEIAFEFANVSGRAAWEMWRALSGFEKILSLPEEWKSLISFMERYVAGSVDRARALQIIQKVPAEYLPILRYSFHHMPKMLTQIAQQLRLADRYEIPIPKHYLQWLTPMPDFKGGDDWSVQDADKVRALLTPDADGKSKLSNDYSRLRKLRGLETNDRHFNALVSRALIALDGKDAARVNKHLRTLTSQMSTEVFAFLKPRLESTIIGRAKEDFGENIDEELLLDAEGPFFDSYVAYKRLIGETYGYTDDDKKLAKDLLASYLNHSDPEYVKKLPHNVAWLSKQFPDERADIWLSENARTFQLDGRALVDNRAKRLADFSGEATRLFTSLGLTVQEGANAQALIDLFDRTDWSAIKTMYNKYHFTMTSSSKYEAYENYFSHV